MPQTLAQCGKLPWNHVNYVLRVRCQNTACSAGGGGGGDVTVFRTLLRETRQQISSRTQDFRFMGAALRSGTLFRLEIHPKGKMSEGLKSGERNGQKISANREIKPLMLCVGRDSSIGIATRYGLEGPGIEPR